MRRNKLAVKKYLDKGFEVIVTSMEMIDAVVEAHGTLNVKQRQGQELKEDHPSTFDRSLREIEGRSKNKR
jgi:hypothetical protein